MCVVVSCLITDIKSDPSPLIINDIGKLYGTLFDYKEEEKKVLQIFTFFHTKKSINKFGMRLIK